MDQKLQDKFKTELEEKYLRHAYEALAIYSFWGKKYEERKKEADGYEKRITDAEAKLHEIELLPDSHTVENRQKAKGCRDDIRQYKDLLERIKKPMQDLEKKIIGLQQDAVETLEQASFIKEFVLKTPEQIKVEAVKKS